VACFGSPFLEIFANRSSSSVYMIFSWFLILTHFIESRKCCGFHRYEFFPWRAPVCILKSSNDIFSVIAVANSISCTSENYSAIDEWSPVKKLIIAFPGEIRLACHLIDTCYYLIDSNTYIKRDSTEMNWQFYRICRRELPSTNETKLSRSDIRRVSNFPLTLS